MKPSCYLDGDDDGVGNLALPVDCALLAADAGSAVHVVRSAGDCDDNDPKRAPTLTDVCDDLIDNDCDGTIDEGFVNKCGGACATGPAHKLGARCENGQLGACQRSGTYVCQGEATVCNAQRFKPGNECKAGIDDDCDGTVDEAESNTGSVFGGGFLCQGGGQPTPL